MSPQSTITSENCCICLIPLTQESLDDSELGPPISIGCQANHEFHRWCLKKLIETNGLSTKCPMDREPIPPHKLIDFAITLNIPLEVGRHDHGAHGILNDIQSLTEHEVLDTRNNSESSETGDDTEISALVHDVLGVNAASLADGEDIYLWRNEPDQDDETRFLNDMRQTEELVFQTESILGERVRSDIVGNESLIAHAGVTELTREQSISNISNNSSVQSESIVTDSIPVISHRSSDFWFAHYPLQNFYSVQEHFYPDYPELWRRIKEIADQQELNRYCLRILEQEINVNLFLSSLSSACPKTLNP